MHREVRSPNPLEGSARLAGRYKQCVNERHRLLSRVPKGVCANSVKMMQSTEERSLNSAKCLDTRSQG